MPKNTNNGGGWGWGVFGLIFGVVVMMAGNGKVQSAGKQIPDIR